MQRAFGYALVLAVGIEMIGFGGARAQEVGGSEPPATAEPGVAGAGQEGPAALEVKTADLKAYLGAYPKMTAFMGKKGRAMEAAGGDPLAGVAAAAGMQAEFEKAVGMPFARFFELHSTVSAAFGEAMAERSRKQQLQALAASVKDLEKQLANKDVKGDLRAELTRQLEEMKAALPSLEQPMPPDPGLSAGTRAVVAAQLEEVEKVFSQQVYTGE